MIIIFKSTVISLLLFIISFNTNAQISYSQYAQHLTTKHGLIDNRVICIAQDDIGYIWIGANSGLCRFDGYNFKEYNKRSAASVNKNKQINCIYNDSKGRLWIGSYHTGLELYNNQLNSFYRYLNKENVISAITEDTATNKLWVATFSKIYWHDSLTDKFIEFNLVSNSGEILQPKSIRVIMISSNGNLWVGTIDDGLYKINLNTNITTHYTNNMANSIKGNTVRALYEDKLGRIWIGLENDGINMFEVNTQTMHFQHIKRENLHRKLLIRDIVSDGDSAIWIATDGDGLINFHLKTKKVQSHTQNDFFSESLASNAINDLYFDKEGLLWLALAKHGVDRMNINQNNFYHFKNNPDDKKSLPSNRVNTIAQDKDGDFWYGTAEGLCTSDKNFSHFSNVGDEIMEISGGVLTIYTSLTNEIYAGTFLGGMHIYNKKTKSFKHINDQGEQGKKLSGNFVRSIVEGPSGNIWIGIIRGGLNKYNTKDQSVINIDYFDKEKGGAALVRCITRDRETFWIGRPGNGLVHYNSKDSTYKNYLHNPLDSTTISDNQVNCILIASDSTIWIGTELGLNLFNPHTETFSYFNIKDGLPNNSIQSMIEDNNKNIWIGTINGLSKFNLLNRSFENYYASDGLQANEFQLNSCYKTKDGYLLFGGVNGFNYFNPNEINKQLTPLKVELTNLYVYNTVITPGEIYNNRVIINKTIENTNEITLTNKEIVFTLHFSALSYSNTKGIKYSYKLDNDTQWVDIGTKNYISFNRMYHGKHILSIRASRGDNLWSKNYKTITINVIPPFYKTKTFIVFVIFFVLLVIFSTYFIRVNRLKQQKKNLEEKVKERTKELYEINEILKESQVELEMQKEEILVQKDYVIFQNEKIKEQNNELESHRTNLEHKVKERTIELVNAKKEAIKAKAEAIKQKENAEKADRLKTSFLANMSHEIRTPLNAILGFIHLIDLPGYSEDKRDSYKKLIHSSGQSLLALINNIIDIAKIESGVLTVQKNKFSLNTVFKDIYTIFEKKIQDEKDHIKLVFNNSEEITVLSDEYRLKQVLINLLDNAFKFTEDGSIEMGFSIQANKVVCYVSDTGVGIEKADQEKIFEQFIKLETNSDKLYRGTGLGLAISKQLIHKMDGEIWLESEYKKGSKFFFTILRYIE